MKNRNFLLGNGDKLTAKVTVKDGGGSKTPPYDFSTARNRVASKVTAAASVVDAVPRDACAHDEAVALLTMHPRYVSKSDFPQELLREVGLRAIGSRPCRVRPDKWGVTKIPGNGTATTAAIFVAGPRAAFDDWALTAPVWPTSRPGADQLASVEDFQAFTARDKIRNIRIEADSAILEFVLHSGGRRDMLDEFSAFAGRHGAALELQRCRRVGDLWFVPGTCPGDIVDELAEFTMLRVIRGMPELRLLQPGIVRGHSGARTVLPTVGPLNPKSRLAIFDGGMPAATRLPMWVRYFEPIGVGPARPMFEEHGLHVTSAALFGNLVPGQPAAVPPSGVDHYRVLDDASDRDPFYLVDVLDRIVAVLDDPATPYCFANISLGPDLAVEDDEVTLWTASLDVRFAGPSKLLTVAAGNRGERDPALGLNRVQPPGDAVNALCVGAADRTAKVWQRASYSCVGPGRSPGVMKPDGVAFGGSSLEPFHALARTGGARVAEIEGTSFASPDVLRASAGISVVLGSAITPLAIRAMMLHRTQRGSLHLPNEVGWGRFVTDIDELITCNDDEAHVIYEGDLPVGQHLRAWVPLPAGTLPKEIEICATLCIATTIDPAHPYTYTQCGTEVAFRPHSGVFTKYKDRKTSTVPKTETFFSPGRMYPHASELELRDGGKWEPVLSNRRKFKSEKLKEPHFDIYFHHRVAGLPPATQDVLPYALIITVRAPGENDLYNSVVRTYQQILQPIQPVINVPIRV